MIAFLTNLTLRFAEEARKYGVLYAAVKVVPQHNLAAHGIDQRYLHGGQLDICWHEVNAFIVVQNAFSGRDGLVHDDLGHERSECNRQLVRFVPTKAVREIALSESPPAF